MNTSMLTFSRGKDESVPSVGAESTIPRRGSFMFIDHVFNTVMAHGAYKSTARPRHVPVIVISESSRELQGFHEPCTFSPTMVSET